MKKIIALALLFTSFSMPVQAKALVQQILYQYAARGDIAKIKQLQERGYSIDSPNYEGNTALCDAVLRRNNRAANILIKMGADRNAKCMQRISNYYKNSSTTYASKSPVVDGSESSGTFLGMGATGWTVAGVVAAGAGVAAAAGGGGGGGGGSSGSSSNDETLNCHHGQQVGNVCQCFTGYTGTLCENKVNCTGYYSTCPAGYDKGSKTCQSGEDVLYKCDVAKVCPYTTKSCGTGYYETGNTCQSGTNIYVECKANACTGYNYTTCPTGYAQSDSCQSGNITKLKCDSCAEDYQKENGVCVKITTCQNGGTFNGTTCSCPEGWTGQYCQTPNGCAGYETTCGTGYHQTTDTCKSGNTTLHKCEANDCSAYQTSCSAGYNKTQSCLSGNTPYYTCTPKDVPDGYTITPCGEGYTQIGTFLSGDDTYYKCEVNDCSGFNYTTCPTGYAQSDSCQSGNITKLKCDNCATGYLAFDGACYVDLHCSELGEYKVQFGDKCITLCGDGYIEQNGTCYAELICLNGGIQNGNSCSCPEGWTGSTCETAKSCSYKTVSCTGGYEETGNTCKSGNTTYKECKERTVPDGYTTAPCGEGYTQIDTLLSGNDTYYKCEAVTCPYNTTECPLGQKPTGNTCKSGKITYIECKAAGCGDYPFTSAPDNCKTVSQCPSNSSKYRCDVCSIGYGKNSSGSCVKISSALTLTTNDKNNSNKEVVNNEYRNVFGLTNDNDNEHYNAYNGNGTIKITNNSDGSVYGVNSESSYAHNAYANSVSAASGNIEIYNKGKGGVYGVRGASGATNAQTQSGSVEGNIKIENTGNGNVYGMQTVVAEFNENQIVSDVLTKNAESKGGVAIASIDIKNIGSGEIHGMDAGSTGVNSLSNSNGESNGTIKINNQGNGEVRGISAEYLAQNATSRMAENEATIQIENVGDGNVKGIHSNGYAHNAASYTGAETTGSIIIKNRGNGDIAAITSADIRDSSIYNTNNETYYYFNDVASFHLYNARANNGDATGLIDIEDEGNGDITVFDTIINNNSTFANYTGNVTYNTYAINSGTAESDIKIKNESSDEDKKTIALSKDTLNLGYAENKGKIINNIEIDNDGNSDIVLSRYDSTKSAKLTAKDNSTIENNIKIKSKGNGNIILPISASSNNSTVKNTIDVENQGNGLVKAIFDATTVSNKEISSDIKVKNKGDGNIKIKNKTGSDTTKSKNKVVVEDTGKGDVSLEISSNMANGIGSTVNNELSITKNGSGIVSLLHDNNHAAALDGGTATSLINIDLNGNNTLDWQENNAVLAAAKGNSSTATNELNIFNNGNSSALILPAFSILAYDNGEVDNQINITNNNSTSNLNLILNADGSGKITSVTTINNTGDNKINVNGNNTNSHVDSTNNFNITNVGNGNIIANVIKAQTTINNKGNGAITVAGSGSAIITNESTGDEAGEILVADKELTLINTGNNNIIVIGDNNTDNKLSVDVTNTGEGNIKLSGNNKAVTLDNTGNGNISVSGDKDVLYMRSVEVKVTNTGEGNIELSGNSKVTTLNNTGNGNITLNENYGSADITNIGNGNIIANAINSATTINNKGNGAITATGSGSANITNESTGDEVGDISVSDKALTLINTGNNNITVSGDNNTGNELSVEVTNTGDGNIELSGNNKAVTLDNTGNGNITVSGNSGSADIISTGTGVMNISGSNSYFIKNEGKSINDTSTGLTSNIIHNSGDNITSTNSNSIIDYRGTGEVDIASSGLVINKNNGSIKGAIKSSVINLSDGNVFNASEIANVDDGLAVGLYTQSDLNNSQNITIHNLGDGVAVGIYADVFAKLTNTGNITIDRESYNGKILHDDGTVEDKTYSATSSVGGKAIGIYGAIGSTINNSGTIKINNAGTAYGIYSEGGKVSNTGTILINGEYTENDIRINGGQLFQDGVLKVGADWNDNGTRSKYADLIGKNLTYPYNNNSSNIVVDNNIYRDVKGLYTKYQAYNTSAVSGGSLLSSTVSINNSSDGNVYGMDGYEIYNSYAKFDSSYTMNNSYGTINIINQGNGDVYGMRGNDERGGSGTVSNAYKSYVSHRDNNTLGIIAISNIGNGNVYGIYTSGNMAAYNSYLYGTDINTDNISTSKGIININNTGTGNIYGMYGNNLYNAYRNRGGSYALSKGTINIVNNGTGNVYGMYGKQVYNKTQKKDYVLTQNYDSTIEVVNNSNGLAVGLYAKDGTIENSGAVKIHNLASGTAVGIYADGTTTVTNNGDIRIDRESFVDDRATEDKSDDVIYVASSDKGGMAIGIYGASGSAINNTYGTITIKNADTFYGIYSEGGKVTNNGFITIDGKTCTGSDCRSDNNAIVLNGGQLFQDGVMIVSSNNEPQSASNPIATPASTSHKKASLNLDDFGGTVIASKTSQFLVEGAISGDLAINNNVVQDGFDTTYKIANMVEADDTSGLNIKSQSALFDAKLENNTDAVMTMKSFDSVVKDDSVAEFLQNNYAAQNNEKLYQTLKSSETVASLNSNVDALFGKEMFSRMAFEDISMLREINFDMNQNLFNQPEGYFALGGNISPSNYDSNLGSVGRYSLNGYNDGKRSFAIGMSIADIRTDNGNGANNRFDRSFVMSAPYGYRTDNGFEFITTPKLGFTNGTYRRRGLDGMNYNGNVQKRMVALMNEARYPFDFSKMTLTAALEFNAIGYNIKGGEDDQDYSLRIKSQNHASVETGFGLTASKEINLTKDSKLKLSGGVAFYHEFANPYELELGMNGMSGTYKMRNDKYGDNRTVVRFGLDYQLQDYLDVTANLLSNIDKETRTDASFDMKYNF